MKALVALIVLLVALAAAATAGAYVRGEFIDAHPGDTISVNNGGLLCSVAQHPKPAGNRIICTAQHGTPYYGVALDSSAACILRFLRPDSASVVRCKYR